MTFCVGEDLLMVSRSWLKAWHLLEKGFTTLFVTGNRVFSPVCQFSSRKT